MTAKHVYNDRWVYNLGQIEQTASHTIYMNNPRYGRMKTSVCNPDTPVANTLYFFSFSSVVSTGSHIISHNLTAEFKTVYSTDRAADVYILIRGRKLRSTVYFIKLHFSRNSTRWPVLTGLIQIRWSSMTGPARICIHYFTMWKLEICYNVARTIDAFMYRPECICTDLERLI